MHGGARLVWPLFQNFSYMDLTPISISVDLKNALSKQNIRIDVPSIFTVGISTEPGIMQNAAERLRSLKLPAIQELAKDIIFGQLRLVIATMDIEEINTNRDKFLDAVSLNVESELKKVGLRLINVNVTDINDESGYIAALGKEAAAKAINDAKKSVAEKNRDGAIGEAMAVKEERIELAQANSIAVEGENESKAKISQSNAKRREIEAEAERLATVAEKIAAAKAKEEAYKAEQQAEIERAKKEKSTLEADVITKALIEKQKIELEAEAEAEKQRRQAQGEADALDLRSRAGDMDGTAILREEEKAPQFDPEKDYSGWPKGAPVQDEGQVWTLLQPYNAKNYEGRPSTLRALWGLCHTKDPEKAKAWVDPYGTSGMYMAGECYREEDGTVWRCKQGNTVHNAQALPSAWEQVELETKEGDQPA